MPLWFRLLFADKQVKQLLDILKEGNIDYTKSTNGGIIFNINSGILKVYFYTRGSIAIFLDEKEIGAHLSSYSLEMVYKYAHILYIKNLANKQKEREELSRKELERILKND